MSDQNGAVLIVMGGLPGTGKTTIARALARRIGAMHVRIDSIEQALRDAGGTLAVGDEGYRVAYAVAEDNLRLGHAVVADSVNPLVITREAWRSVALRSEARCIEVEVVCSDAAEHRRRVESRQGDIEGLKLPSWQDVIEREYEVWEQPHLVIDTAMMGVEEAAGVIEAALEGGA